MSVDTVIERLRVAVKMSGLTQKEIAARSGLHPNTLLGINSTNWSPSVATMRALEALLLSKNKKKAPQKRAAPTK